MKGANKRNRDIGDTMNYMRTSDQRFLDWQFRDAARIRGYWQRELERILKIKGKANGSTES